MNTHAYKRLENISQSVANAVAQKQSGGEATFQFVDKRPEAIAQRKRQKMANNSPQVKRLAQLQTMADNYTSHQPQLIQKKENNTGLPDNLKSGIENLSGYSMDDVKVHHNSDKPAQLQAYAYAQGIDIHLGPGQEKHLPHEAWHVVQQKQGRVKPTMQMKGKVNVNDNANLEKEADVMGTKALTFKAETVQLKRTSFTQGASQLVVQRIEYGDAVAGNNYQINGIEHRLIKKEYGWLYFEGLNNPVRASQVEEVPLASSSSMAPRPYSGLTDEYSHWDTERAFSTVSSPFGSFNVRHNRKAPYITTNTTQYPDTSVRVDYSDIINALRKEQINDQDIARILLDSKTDGLTNPNAIRAAAMLVGIVYLAEEWRKQGAVKIFRAILRLIMSGTMSLSDIPRVFEFVSSAKDGREQVARIHQVLSGKLPIDSLDSDDQAIFGSMSPMRHGDIDSDDDTRHLKEDDFKHGRSWGVHGMEARQKGVDHHNIFKINGRFYNIADPRIAHDGQCLWDTMMLFGVVATDLQNAAQNIPGVTYGDYVDIDQLNDIVDYLNNHGHDLSIELNVFGYQGNLISHHVIGSGSTTYRLGLVVDPHGLGHFIPSLN
ncbi:MAG: hypothetical protein ACJAVN_000359 [Roseivirga sp.]|jgi:hypothetical protein